MSDERLLALCYDFYNKHLLVGQNEDIKYYEKQIKSYKPKKVLIVGAGTGRIAIPLSNTVDITALDINEFRLTRLNQKKTDVKTICMDICLNILNEKYDMVILPYSTFQLIISKKETNNFFINLYNVLENNGILILDISENFNFKQEVSDLKLFEDYCPEIKSNIEVIFKSKRYKHFIKFKTRFLIKDIERYVVEIEKYSYYDKDKIENLLNNNNLCIKKIDRGYGKKDFQHKYLYHCRKAVRDE